MGIVIGVIVVLGIIGAVVFVLLKRNSDDDDYYDEYDEDEYDEYYDDEDDYNQAPMPSPQMQQQNVPTQSAPVEDPSVARVKNTLMTAQSFMAQQRYDEAEAELKKGLTFDPKDSSLQLKLLNLYAVTNNTSAFPAVYSEVVNNGNADDIKQAESLKSMLDAEQESQNFSSNVESAQPSTEETPAAAEEDDTGLDFAAFTASINEESEPKKAEEPSSTPDDDGLSFDGFDDALFSDDAKTEEKTVTKEETFDDAFGDLSLSIGDDEKAKKEDADTGLDFDLPTTSDDTEKATSTDLPDEFSDLFGEGEDDEPVSFGIEDDEVEDLSAVDDTALDDFNFDDFGLEETKKEEVKAEEELPSFDDFDLGGIATEEVKETEKAEETASVEDELPSFDDFDLGGIATEEVKETEKAEETASVEDELPSFDDFDLGGIATEEVKETKKAEETASVEDELPSFDDFDLGVETAIEEVKETEKEEVANVDNDLASFDDFDLSETAKEEPLDLEIPDEEELETVDGNDFQLPAEFLEADFGSSKKEKPADNLSLADEETTTSTDLEPEDKLSIINEIDNNQVTLDLAKNYLDLGEYDSAKRLLSEVIEAGTEEQQTEAKSLLARVG